MKMVTWLGTMVVGFLTTTVREQGKSDLGKMLPCGHQYHRSCLVKWFERRVTCPKCRLGLNQERASRWATDPDHEMDPNDRAKAVIWMNGGKLSDNDHIALGAYHNDQDGSDSDVNRIERALNATNTGVRPLRLDSDSSGFLDDHDEEELPMYHVPPVNPESTDEDEVDVRRAEGHNEVIDQNDFQQLNAVGDDSSDEDYEVTPEHNDTYAALPDGVGNGTHLAERTEGDANPQQNNNKITTWQHGQHGEATWSSQWKECPVEI